MDGNIFPGDLRLWLNDWRDPIQIGQIDTVCLPTTRLVWPKVPEIGESVRINRHHAHSVVYFVNFSLPLRRSSIKFHISNESLHDCVRVCHLREYFIPYLIFWLETKIPNLIRSQFSQLSLCPEQDLYFLILLQSLPSLAFDHGIKGCVSIILTWGRCIFDLVSHSITVVRRASKTWLPFQVLAQNCLRVPGSSRISSSCRACWSPS